MKKTAWFPAGTKPARPGVYEVKSRRSTYFQHWDGSMWGLTGDTVKFARRCRGCESYFQTPIWRGLTRVL